jgi:glycosyltransferase involved in cell wall biosynthesis
MCIESALASQEQDFEIAIFDDGSSDIERNRLDDISQLDKRIRIIYGDGNKGCGYGFDLLSKEAEGEIIHYVGADDLIHPRRIADALEFHECHRYANHPEQKVPLLATGYRHLDHNYKLLPRARPQQYSHEEIRTCMFLFTPIAHGTVSIPRLGYKHLSPYPGDRRAGVDYLFYCKNNNRLEYFYIDKLRYYIRLKQKSLTRSPTSRKHQLQSHDLGMQHLWSQVLGPVEFNDITLIRRLCISRDDYEGQDLGQSSEQLNRIMELLERMEKTVHNSFYMTRLIVAIRQSLHKHKSHLKQSCNGNDSCIFVSKG